MTQEEALTVLKTGANVFLTGEPGSGKTHTVNTYVAWLRARGIEPAITASTGIAATHIGGYTIHSWSGIGIKRRLSAYELDHIAQNESVAKRVRGTDILILDEVSMLSADTLAMVEAVCREVRGNDKPFGGLQVVLVGDFFQLPPVVSREETENEEQDMFATAQKTLFAFSSPAWEKLNPIVCYLHEQHRQEDEDFLGLLSAIRRGDIDDTHREMLAARKSTQAVAGRTQLFSHNADVDRINNVELTKLSSDAHTFAMAHHGPAKLVEALKRGCLSPETLALKVGARVMFTKNDVGAWAYVNGTLGTVEGFAKETGNPIVKTHAGRTLVVEPTEWRIDDGGRTLAHITQLPLRLAWAMTVHKSQGMSLDAAHMDLSGAFEYGQGYVALSRVRTLAGLTLAGINEQALRVHPQTQEKDAEFRTASQAAERAFARISADELNIMQNNFIKACGGSLEPHAHEAPIQTKSKLDALREKYPNAYRPWSKEEDERLKEKFLSGESQKNLAGEFGRRSGAIRSRLVKLGLIEEE